MIRAMPIGFFAFVLVRVLQSFLATHSTPASSAPLFRPTAASSAPVFHHAHSPEALTQAPIAAAPRFDAAPAVQNDGIIQMLWTNYFRSMATFSSERARHEREEEARRKEDDKRWEEKHYREKREQQRQVERADEASRAEARAAELKRQEAQSNANAAGRRWQTAEDDARAQVRRATARAAENAAWDRRRRY